MPSEVLVDWTTPSGGGKVSVFYFPGTNMAAERLALSTFLNSVDNTMTTSTTWSIRNSGRILNAATGQLTGEWSDASIYTASGGISGSPIPDASQVLVRWTTGVVVNGRFLKGRTFLPGVSSSFLVSGNLGGTAVSTINNAASALAGDVSDPVIWHRPVAGAGGSIHSIASGSVWTELAVLRRRRG